MYSLCHMGPVNNTNNIWQDNKNKQFSFPGHGKSILIELHMFFTKKKKISKKIEPYMLIMYLSRGQIYVRRYQSSVRVSFL